ncbi:DUF2007 domain-containing protein [Flavobacterium sp. UMI-01]|uniref:DUF2007 domain-containing protein n=1 Tax=Flavobacterium sp. UMI-01 TaxID=1441053 RepID=UPI001C7CC461|nr:DUF2007 domain-containing protein [Flavobacterium sp. UMI-01]GIZ09931.1 hypothetical protein FUMI01_26570 [Flavobacterium sp. UMI-01]
MKNRFLLLNSYLYSSEALIFKGKLESEGIDVFIRDSNTVDSNPLYSHAIGGVKLFVKKEDFNTAKQILTEISNFSLDDSNNLVKCPKCGAKKAILISSIKDTKSMLSFIVSFFLGSMSFYVKQKYQCTKCKNEFK